MKLLFYVSLFFIAFTSTCYSNTTPDSSSLEEPESKRLLIFGPSAKINEILASVQCIKQFLTENAGSWEQKNCSALEHKLDALILEIQKQGRALQHHDDHLVHLFKKIMEQLQIILTAIEDLSIS